MRQRIQFLRPQTTVQHGEAAETFAPAFRVWADVSIPTLKGQVGEMALAGGAEASQTLYRIAVSRLPEDVTTRWRLFLGLKQCEIVALEKTSDKGAVFNWLLAREVY